MAVSIGRGNIYRQREMKGMASDPNEKNVIYLDDFNDFDARDAEISNSILEYICNSKYRVKARVFLAFPIRGLPFSIRT